VRVVETLAAPWNTEVSFPRIKRGLGQARLGERGYLRPARARGSGEGARFRRGKVVGYLEKIQKIDACCANREDGFE
jgi:hypothetical protein